MFKCVNPAMDSFDNLLDVTLLQEKWLNWATAPGRGKVTGKGHLPGTLRSYLGSLCKFVEFLMRERTVPWCGKLYILCNVKVAVMRSLLEELKNWSASYLDEVDQREWDVTEPQKTLQAFTIQISPIKRGNLYLAASGSPFTKINL